jgi:hypothetical protein
MMSLYVAVITRKIVQERYLARFSHFAELLQDPMDRGRWYVGMVTANWRADVVCARMVLRSEQRLYYCEPLGGDSNPTLTTSGDELEESLNWVPLAPAPIYQPDFSHNHSWPATNSERGPNPIGETDTGWSVR